MVSRNDVERIKARLKKAEFNLSMKQKLLMAVPVVFFIGWVVYDYFKGNL